MPHENLVGAEGMPVGAAGGRSGNPLPPRGLHEVAEHPIKPRPRGHPVRISVGCGATIRRAEII
jgi:hypothetical protein